MKKEEALSALCKTLEKKSKNSAENEILLTRQEVGNYINNDKNRYLLLKAEADYAPSAIDTLNHVFSFQSFAVAALALISVLFASPGIEEIYWVIAVAFVIELLVALRMMSLVRPVNKWRKYILAVINEFNPEEVPEKNTESN